MSLSIDRGCLDGLMVFLAVADAQGFRPAAKQLGISPSAISQAIRVLEIRIGAPLFFRTTRSIALTEAGQQLLSFVRPAIEMVNSGISAAATIGREVTGLLRINVPRAVLPMIANRLLPDFFEAYPKVQLELFADDGLSDIVKSGFDAGIRLGQFVQPDSVAVRLTDPIKSVVVGSPAFFSKHGRPQHPEDLLSFACVQLRFSTQALTEWEFLLDGQVMKVAVNGPLIVNDIDIRLRAALRGVGLARMPELLALHYLQTGELEAVLEPFHTEMPGLMLYNCPS
jgi:DNA-binding transcriptional LysR family regulator